jgi:phosphate starvation-inducible protein PhoH
MRLIDECDVILCNGMAGCGKTLLSIGMSLKLLRAFPETYNRIILVRPAVAIQGEDLGYLPGSIDDKLDPYLAPMMDSLRYFLDEGAIATLL